MNFKQFLAQKIKDKKPIFFDGAMGSLLQKTRLPYDTPEDLNITNPSVILDIHSQYIKAGSAVISCNTFGLNPLKKTASKYSWQKRLVAGIEIAKKAASTQDSPCFVAWDSGQIGTLMQPMGSLCFEDAYNAYKQVAILAQKAGAQLAIIETFSDLYEMKAAILAIKENTSLPIVSSMTFSPDLRTLTGANVLTVCNYLEALSPDVLGFNCGGGLTEDAKLVKDFCKYSHIPLIVQPNAGLPVVENSKTIYKLKSNTFSTFGVQCIKQGVNILGGCCGTTPEHIERLVSGAFNLSVKKRNPKNLCLVSTGQNTVQIGGDAGPIIIGERINPTGKKRCKEALLNADKEFLIDEAQKQIKAGAKVLDINTGLPVADEKSLMLWATKTISQTFPATPLQIDSSDPAVLEAALRQYNGKPLINSVNGKKEVMANVLPLVAKYGGVVVGLCIDENGIPPLAQDRVKIAKNIIQECQKYNIPIRNIAIDTLTLTISSQQEYALQTLKAISTLKKEYEKQGLQFVLGVSNISFGLPLRPVINSNFLSMALYAGLSAAIINPLCLDMTNAFAAYRALSGFDANCTGFIDYATKTLALQTPQANTKANTKNDTTSTNDIGSTQNTSTTKDDKKKALIDIIQNGFKDKAASVTQSLVKQNTPTQIIDECIVPALDCVGKDYETGKKFLPQLLLSADTVSSCFEVIKKALSKSATQQQTKGKILLATVEGDIHDIGKNIVKAMLENYGYTVIDMGKNVPPQNIVDAIKSQNITLVGLSALMTTTVASMQKTIELINTTINKTSKICCVMVGGAVLTPGYAIKIGADFYAKDAMASVQIAKQIFGK